MTKRDEFQKLLDAASPEEYDGRRKAHFLATYYAALALGRWTQERGQIIEDAFRYKTGTGTDAKARVEIAQTVRSLGQAVTDGAMTMDQAAKRTFALLESDFDIHMRTAIEQHGKPHVEQLVRDALQATANRGGRTSASMKLHEALARLCRAMDIFVPADIAQAFRKPV